MTAMAHEQADWQRLGRAVVARRVELGFNTQVAFADHLGMTARILGDIEGGKRTSYDRSTLARIERGMDWPSGAIDGVLSGRPADRVTERIDGSMAGEDVLDELAAEMRAAMPDDRGQLVELVRRVAEWARYRRTAK
jgi:hypothetical protein